jgi:hypothetical protein
MRGENEEGTYDLNHKSTNALAYHGCPTREKVHRACHRAQGLALDGGGVFHTVVKLFCLCEKEDIWSGLGNHRLKAS